MFILFDNVICLCLFGNVIGIIFSYAVTELPVIVMPYILLSLAYYNIIGIFFTNCNLNFDL